MAIKIKKDYREMYVDDNIAFVFQNDGWEVVGDTLKTPQKDDTDTKDDKSVDLSSNDKKSLKKRFNR
jgi:hypothetical protein